MAQQQTDRPVRVRVLLLEDDPSYAQFVCHHVGRDFAVPCEVEVFATLKDALARMARGDIDLVISDLNVPDSHGTATIAALAAASRQPIIGISADDDPGLREQAMRGGAYEFLPKRSLNKATLERHVRLAAMHADGLRSLKEAKRRLELALEGSGAALWDTNLATGEVFLSDGWAALLGAPPRETRTTIQALIQMIHPDDRARALEISRLSLKGRLPAYILEHRVRAHNGEWRWILSRGKVIERDADGRALRMSGTNVDVTERKQAEAALLRSAEEIRDLYNNAPCGYHSLDANGVFVQMNDIELGWLGFPREEVIGRMRFTDVLTPEGVQLFHQTFDAFKRDGGTLRDLEFQLRHRDGSLRSVLLSSSAMRDAQGRFVMSRSTLYDVTDRKEADARIRYLAQHDALTGLPNRLLLQDRINQAIAQAHRSGRQVAVLFIDLDHFKHINDSLGHEVGDGLLRAAAVRLQECLREGDSVCRLGGDEFVISLPSIADSRDAAVVATKVLEALARPFHVDGRELHVGGSIGISVSPNDGEDANALMRAADTAMYHAKEKGRNNYRFFTPALNDAAQQRLALAGQLRQALAQNEFALHYQPQVDLDSGQVFSVEALLRWQKPGEEPISCADFISVAEETGLISPLGEWALREACEQLKRWRAAGHRELQVAVNLSARQFYQASFHETVARVLRDTGLPPSALELEITESLLMLPSPENLLTLERLAKMGIRLSVDDFGMGYSSLAYLQRFPIHSLKIDRSFVSGIGRDASHTAIVTAIIAMAQSLRLKVVAEGVENAEQVRFLKSHGCLAAQGYFYGRPLSASALEAALRAQFVKSTTL